jgi:riboflavin kinase/FMN adenylyltransferase
MKKYPKRSVVTIGVFDGVHLGHRKIITETVSTARDLGLKSIVITFEPHPMKVLKHGHSVPSLISLEHRIRLIKELGVDKIVVINFTKSVAGLSAETFIKNTIIKRLGAKRMIVGENFYFGRGAKAGAGTLEDIGKLVGVSVKILKPVKKAGRVVSSSVIRRLILAGRLDEASDLLGRRVSILGDVVSGSKFARVLGYPTANINPHHEIIPPFGVYAVKVRYGGKSYKGLLNIGTRPTFFSSHDKEPDIEVHIFGFNKNIYGKRIEVFFIKKLRNERKFANKEGLMCQIRRDAKAAKQVL